MPVQTDVNDYMTGVILIEGKDGGQSERFNFNTTSYATAKTGIETLATKFARILPAGFSILRATVSQKSVRGDANVGEGYTYLPVLVGSESSIETPNNPGSGFLVRFDTGDGKFSNRNIRPVRDSWIADNRRGIAAFTVYAAGGPYLTYSAPAAEVDLVGDLLASIRDLTVLIRKSGFSNPAYRPYTFTSWQYRRIATHDYGQRHGISRGRQPAYS
jgi:hypothetical protein